jgi:hypothetical protein
LFYLLRNTHRLRDVSYEVPFHLFSISTLEIIELPWDRILKGCVGFPLNNSWLENVQLTGLLIFLFLMESLFLLALCGPYLIWRARAKAQYMARQAPRQTIAIAHMMLVAEHLAEDDGKNMTVWVQVEGCDDGVEVLEVKSL